MDLDLEAMQQETAAQFGVIAARNQILAGQLGAAVKRNKELTEENTALKAKLEEIK